MAWTPTPGQKARMQGEVADEANQLADITNTIDQLNAIRDDKLELDTINMDLLTAHLTDFETYVLSPGFADPLRLANTQVENQSLSNITPGVSDIFVLNFLPYNGGSDLTLFRGATPCTFTLTGKTLTNISPAPGPTPALYTATYTPEMQIEKSWDAGRESYPLSIPLPDDGAGATPVMVPDLSDITNWRVGANPDIIAPFTVGLTL